MHNFNILKNKRGFSILEIVIATVIIAVSFLPILTLMQTSNRAYKKSDNNAIAYNLAMEALEWARSIPFDRLETKYIDNRIEGFIIPVTINKQTPFKTDPDNVNGIPGQFITYPDKFFQFFSNFQRKMDISKIGTDDRMKLVEVVVSWEEPLNQGKTSFREEVVRAVVVDTRPY